MTIHTFEAARAQARRGQYISTTGLQQAALALAARSMRVFPIGPRKNEPPLFEKWQEHTTDTSTIRNWWRDHPNIIGIATGPDSGIWALDIDGGGGETALRKLEAEHGALAPSVEAGSGEGRHLCFRWPQGCDIRNSQCRDDIAGIDVRGKGGYVLAPPSLHPSGRRYAAQWLIDIVTSKQTAGHPLQRQRKRGAPSSTLIMTARTRGAAVARLGGYLLRGPQRRALAVTAFQRGSLPRAAHLERGPPHRRRHRSPRSRPA
jgi:hypothetical protein